MKKLFAATVSIAALCCTSAFAADMALKAPVYKAPIKAAPGYNWTGWYGGVNVGVGVSQSDVSDPNDPPFSQISGVGFAGGVQLGYNWQVAPQWVFGLEGDVGYLGIDHAILTGTRAFGVKTDWFATVRGRLGYTNGPSLFYVTGGAAFVNVKNSVELTSPPPVLSSTSEAQTGWTVGGGIETALGGNWSAKAEYLYIDAGQQNVVDPDDGTSILHFDNRFHVYRYGLNYKFGNPVANVLPAHNWTGFYAGANAGATLSQVQNLIPDFITDLSDTGFTGGVQLGYNWQVAPQWVAGFEGDIGYLGIDHSTTSVGVKTDWFGTVRGRLGYSTGPALLYATGGAAFVNVRNAITFITTGLHTSSETATGWTVGGGIEAALAPNWTAKTEYLYIDAGKQDVFVGSPIENTTFDNRFHVFRAGLNYQFTAAPMMAPVAARY